MTTTTFTSWRSLVESELTVTNEPKEVLANESESESGKREETPEQRWKKEHSTLASLQFADFVDVQTRLVLLPCVEDEGLGAVVASFTARDDGNQVDPSGCKDKENADPDHGPPPTITDFVGASLVGVQGHDGDEKDWLQKDFTDILSIIRDASTPIVLFFEKEDDEDVLASPDDEDEEQRQDAGSDDTDTDDDDEDEPERSTLDRLSFWGSRVRAQAQIAASVVATAAIEAKERRATQLVAEQQTPDVNAIFNLFLQTSFDKFERLAFTSTKLTTSSVVLVRQSELESCPTEGYTFQWFRSLGDKVETSSHGSKDSRHDEDEIEWILLNGATYASYQPSATDVGHRLKCLVRIEKPMETKPGEESTTTESDIVTCETRHCVSADMSLFNGARQALVRGAQFSNLVGRGNAEGRTFRVQIEISMSDKIIASAMIISQVSGSTSEPMHSRPIIAASAVSDPCNPKYLDLVFPKGLPDSAGMIQALSSHDGRLQLEAPNRLTRETLLLALGIANFNGKPADLTTSTVLFAGREAEMAAPSIVETNTVGPVTPDRETIEQSEFFTPHEPNSPSRPELERSSSNDRVRALELELQHLLSKMTRKDKVISDLQRQLTNSESQRQVSETNLASCQQELRVSREESQDLRTTAKNLQKRVHTQEVMIRNLQNEHKQQTSSFETRLIHHTEKIADLEKNLRSMQNEKAVLTAGIDARDSKLCKMAELQATADSLSIKVASTQAIKDELKELQCLYQEQVASVRRAAASEKEARLGREEARAMVDLLNVELENERQNNAVIKRDLEDARNKNQKLQSDRNSCKQKADSLSKEISRLCKNGRNLEDVRRIVTDEESRITEVEILKAQKKKALDDLTEYRIAYQQSLVTQLRSRGMDGAAIKATEKISALERVVSELTEYVNAKEMQLETMMQVNLALAEEVTSLARANMHKNDI